MQQGRKAKALDNTGLRRKGRGTVKATVTCRGADAVEGVQECAEQPYPVLPGALTPNHGL